MVAYMNEVKAMSMKIRDFKIRQISREENKKADALTNLASAFDFISDRSVPLEFLPNTSIDITKIPLPVLTSPMSHRLIKLIANLHLAIHSKDEVTRSGTYWLEDMKRKALPYPWNAEHLKKYYQ
ncbi:hypothetical protein Acr_00g0056980 [Actinidia rufa]|uniref:RNase H type-1 domain-containing protein n=1 Tax=Actinidia rufa TaxID=165716 RepID=A0A7J0DMY8_9ERIC|nr:hypothetical protein Acr_00g0056980 [Actinidia rufa]